MSDCTVQILTPKQRHTELPQNLSRFPYCQIPVHCLLLLFGYFSQLRRSKQGYVYFDWNASLEDAAKKTTPEMLLQNARESTLGRKKVVMLAHDIQYNTVLCLEDLIDLHFRQYNRRIIKAANKNTSRKHSVNSI